MRKLENPKKTTSFRFRPAMNEKLNMVAHKLRTTRTMVVEVALEKLFRELQDDGTI